MCYVAWMFFSFSSPSAGVKYQRLRFTKELVVFIIALRPRRAGGRAGGDVTRNTNPETATVAFFLFLCSAGDNLEPGDEGRSPWQPDCSLERPPACPAASKPVPVVILTPRLRRGCFVAVFFFKKMYLITKLKRYTHDT